MRSGSMKWSKYNIVQDYKGKKLLYNALSTSLVEIENSMFNSIFELMEFDKYPEEANALLEMGFLVLDAVNEDDEQRKIRQTVIDNNSGKIANIIIAPTLECNAHCFYCFEKGFRKGTMSQDTANALVQHLLSNWNGRHLGITWFGGEPLMATDIISYVSEKLSDEGVAFSSKIVTNGLLLDDRVVEHSKTDWRVDKIQVSVDAVGEEYNKIKNFDHEIGDPFSKIITNIDKASRRGVKIKIRINFDPENKERAISTMDFLSNRFKGFDNIKIYFAPIDEENCVVKNISQDFDKYDEHPYISLIKYGRKNGLYRGFPDMEDDEGLEFDEHGLLKKLKIYPGVTNCYATCPSVYSIDANGLIYKCHRLLGRKEYSSGDVFGGMIKNEVYNFFCNTDVTYRDCEVCSIMPICQGGCKVNAMLYHGHEACAPSKAIIKDLILLYKEDLDNAQSERR